MGKTKKDSWERIRVPIPRPGKPITTKKDYNRKRDKSAEEDDDDY